jgi:Sensors of blue-light using FAD
LANLIQLVYISRATFVPTIPSNAINPHVSRILMEARTKNKKNGLVGVLYFGDDCFFQCLEGEEEAVMALYAKLLKDPRHKDLKVISTKPINVKWFLQWNMKYVPLEKNITQLLEAHGQKTFDPYRFNSEMTQSMLDLLHGASEATEITLD